MSLSKLSIGDVAKNHGLTTHTLRYYVKIGLLAPVGKDSGGRRRYSQSDIERLRFIKRAQRMHFSLKEIHLLIDLERAPQMEKPQAQ